MSKINKGRVGKNLEHNLELEQSSHASLKSLLKRSTQIIIIASQEAYNFFWSTKALST